MHVRLSSNQPNPGPQSYQKSNEETSHSNTVNFHDEPDTLTLSMTECSLNEIVLFRENETARHMEIGSSRSCLLRTGRILFIFLLFSEIADSVLRLPSSRSATSIFLFFADRLDRSSNFRHRPSPFDSIQQRFVHSPSRYEAASCPRRLSFVSELEQLDPWKCRNLAVSLNSVPYASSTRILHSVSMIRHSFSAFFITRSTTPREEKDGQGMNNFSFNRREFFLFQEDDRFFYLVYTVIDTSL